jgi:hypothetical protein
MKLTNVSARVAIERMWIYATALDVNAREDLQANLLNGHAVTYLAYTRDGEAIGRTRLEPEQFPVMTVTETTF